MNRPLPMRDVVLIGAGHTHLHVVRMWRMSPLPNVRLTLISPFGRATYSGMLPGTLAGLYQPDDMEIDLVRLAGSSGVRFITDEAIDVDVSQRQILFRDRVPLRFDVASIGVGSVPAGITLWSGEVNLLAIKPMATFRTRLQQRIESLRSEAIGSRQRPMHIVVVGGGAAGVEIALCLNACLCEQGVQHQLTLLDAGPMILRGSVDRTRMHVLREFAQRGIPCRTDARVTRIVDGVVTDSGGEQTPADIVVWATGAAPSSFIDRLDLPKADDGFLAIRPTLQSIADVPIFAVGDCGSLTQQRIAKAGVIAVREGPVLWANIGKFLRGEELNEFVPQQGFLKLLADGRGRAFVDYRGLATHSQWAWRLKDYIDRRFMQMHQDYRPMPVPQPAPTSASTPMKCMGCGGKAGSQVLQRAFARLLATSPEWRNHQALKGTSDAAELSKSGLSVDLVTVDFFEAFVDDAWLVGRIAALNACSDIWAMGGRPHGALAAITLPAGNEEQQTETLFQALAGALREFAAADVELLGGHTIEGASLSVGFTILGTLGAQTALRKSGLQPGDALILTKPVGTGVILAGLMSARSRAVWLDAALRSMLVSNRDASEFARRHQAHAMTDVTGFGLAGHLVEMLSASDVSATLWFDQIPRLQGADELWSLGVCSTLDPANRTATSDALFATDDLKQRPEFAALFDPQTSGGLLIGLPADAAIPLLADLEQIGLSAAQIGVVNRSVPTSGYRLTVQRR